MYGLTRNAGDSGMKPVASTGGMAVSMGPVSKGSPTTACSMDGSSPFRETGGSSAAPAPAVPNERRREAAPRVTRLDRLIVSSVVEGRLLDADRPHLFEVGDAGHHLLDAV